MTDITDNTGMTKHITRPLGKGESYVFKWLLKIFLSLFLLIASYSPIQGRDEPTCEAPAYTLSTSPLTMNQGVAQITISNSDLGCTVEVGLATYVVLDTGNMIPFKTQINKLRPGNEIQLEVAYSERCEAFAQAFWIQDGYHLTLEELADTNQSPCSQEYYPEQNAR